MVSVSEDRWTCAKCNGTVVINGSQDDVLAAIRACQTRHYVEHRKAADILSHLGLPEPKKSKRRPAA